jgi:uncharacterized damage-inducible protein DinB
MTIAPPQTAEFNPFYAGYVGKVTADGPFDLLKDQIASFERLKRISDEQADHRYAPGKWSVKELLGHMSDTERLFSYRLLHIARGDRAALAGMDEKAWSAAAPHDRRRISEIADEMVAVRRATVKLIESLDDAALARSGVANNYPISARALVWIMPGHAQHHLDILRERYGVAV